MLRVIPTAAHSLEDVAVTIEAFKQVKSKLDNGIYRNQDIYAGIRN
jgi:glycine C-acetyltransferase